MFDPKNVIHWQKTVMSGAPMCELNSVLYSIDEDACVSIREFVDISTLSRVPDVQSGDKVVMNTTYKVRTYKKCQIKGHTKFIIHSYSLTMSEIFTKYPWFFEIISQS